MDNSSFYAMLSRMKYINRWGLMRSTREENLAEHSLEVAILAHALAVIGNRRLGRNYDAGKLVLYALYHDCSEIITGDLPTPIKYQNPQIRDSYKAIEYTANQRLLSMLPNDLRPDYEGFFAVEPEDDAAKLVKAADKISALLKCMEEENAGNREFRKARQATEQAIREMHLPEADVFLHEFLHSYDLTLDEL
ncbi:5'-deoxynucleotidase [Hydrogenoanaerobacterium sp.]|uniref:5'-deoxynucleotidase n=1 Tax=Hydrogenoanaerobacterium sp. TaxID=2953763 RepID=UPI0028A044F2|nr:5'-deoxynucleotidase [Hydrogenoanaerobacterium sp.]